MQEELDFVYFSSIHKARTEEKQVANEKPHLLICDEERYASKCAQAYGMPVKAHDSSGPLTSLSGVGVIPKRVDTRLGKQRFWRDPMKRKMVRMDLIRSSERLSEANKKEKEG